MKIFRMTTAWGLLLISNREALQGAKQRKHNLHQKSHLFKIHLLLSDTFFTHGQVRNNQTDLSRGRVSSSEAGSFIVPGCENHQNIERAKMSNCLGGDETLWSPSVQKCCQHTMTFLVYWPFPLCPWLHSASFQDSSFRTPV